MKKKNLILIVLLVLTGIFSIQQANADFFDFLFPQSNPDLIEQVQGSNFDEERYINGSNVRLIYPYFRVFDFYDQDGKPQFTSYKLSEGSTWITYESQSVTFTYNKNTCAMKFYDIGRIDGNNPIIKSDSFVVKGKQLNATTWSDVNIINNAVCNTVLTSSANEVKITSTKSVANVGTFKTIWTMPSFGQLKVTLEATNNNPAWTSHQVGFTETIQVPQFIKLGNQTYNLANFGGTVLDRTWIENNQAKLIKLADRINYNFGLGFDQVSNIKINWDGSQASLNFNYLNVGQVNVGQTVVVDPQIGIQTGTTYAVDTTLTAATDCLIGENIVVGGTALIEKPTTASADCNAVAFKFNTQDLPDFADVTNTELIYDVTAISTPINCDYNELTFDPATASAVNLWTDLGDGVNYVNNDTTCTTVANGKVEDLGTSADARVEVLNASGYFAVGMIFDNMVRDATLHSVTMANPKLRVTYTVIYPPTTPLTQTASAGENLIVLNWATPSSNGGSAITGYDILRTSGDPLLTEPLPNDNQKDNPALTNFVNMTGNTLLYHFNDIVTTFADSSGNAKTAVGGDTIYDESEYNDATTWTQVGTLITVNDLTYPDVVKWAAALDGTDRRVHRALAATLDNDRFIAEFEFTVTARTTPDHMILVLQAGNGNPDTTTQDRVGVSYRNTNQLQMFQADNTITESYSGGINIAGNATQYVRLERTTPTNLSLKVFSDQTRTAQVGSTINLAIPNTIITLTNIQHSVLSSGSASNSLTATLDNFYVGKTTLSNFFGVNQIRQTGKIDQTIQFNGKFDILNVTHSTLGVRDLNDWSVGAWIKNVSIKPFALLSYDVTPTAQTKLMVAPRFASIETDNTKVLSGSSTTTYTRWEDHMTTSTGWSQTGTKVTADNASFPDRIHWEGVTDETGQFVSKTLPAALSDSTWAWEGVLNVQQILSPTTTQVYVVIFQSGGGDPNLTTADKMGILLEGTASGQYVLYPCESLGSDCIQGATGSDPLNVNQNYYLRFSRTGTTQTSLEVFGDAAMEQRIGQMTDVTSASNTGLNTIIHATTNDGLTGATYYLDLDDQYVGYLPDSVFHYWEFTRSDNTFNIYRNGTLLATTTTATNLGAPTNNFYFIGRNGTGSTVLNGNTLIDEFHAFNRTLASTEVTKINTRGSGSYTLITTTGVVTTFTNSGLADNAQWFYKIRGQNAFTDGAATSYITATTYDIPSIPQAITATRVSSSAIDAKAVIPNDGGGTEIEGYYFQRKNVTNYYYQPFIENEKSHWRLDWNTYDDVGTLNNDATLTAGSASFVTGKIYRGFNGDGNSYLTVPSETSYDWERTSVKSFCLWLKTGTASDMVMLAKGGTAGLDQEGTMFYLTSAGHIVYTEADAAGSQKLKVRDASYNNANNNFQHVCIVDTGTSTAAGVKIYRNATLQTNTVDSDTLTTNSIQNNDAVTLLARDGGGSKFTGVLDDVRYFDRTISAAEISKLYNDALILDNEVSRFKFNWDTLDYVGSNHGIVTGIERYTDSNFPHSQLFNGNTYTTIANETKSDFPNTQPFSITFWSWLPSTIGQNTIFAKTNDWVGTTSAGYGVGYNSSGYMFFKINDGTTVISRDTSSTTSLNAWNFFAVTKGVGTTQAALKIYKNGLDVTNTNEDGTLASSILNDLSPIIGAESDAGRKADNGVRLDEVRIYSKELSSTEVNSIYGNSDISAVYSDTGLARFTQYSYKATAVNRVGESAVTSFANATTYDVPNSPTSLTATPISATRIDLSWVTPTNNGGSAITGYRIERNQTTIDAWGTLVNNTGTTTTTYSDTAITQNHQERYRVAAWNIFGLGSYSNNATATTQESTTATISGNKTVVKNVVGISPKITLTTGIPSPTVQTLYLLVNDTVDQTRVVSQVINKGQTIYFAPFYKEMPLNTLYNLKTRAEITSVGGGPITVTSAANATLPLFQPIMDTNNGITFNVTHARNVNYEKLTVNITRSNIPHNTECSYKDSLFGDITWLNRSQVGYYYEIKNVQPNKNVRVTCYGSGQFVAFTSFGFTNGTLTLLAFTEEMGTFFNVPIPFFFVILFAALWTGRSAPTGVIALTAVIGIMGVSGYFPDGAGDNLITAAIWGIIIMLCAIGVFIGKKYL